MEHRLSSIEMEGEENRALTKSKSLKQQGKKEDIKRDSLWGSEKGYIQKFIRALRGSLPPTIENEKEENFDLYNIYEAVRENYLPRVVLIEIKEETESTGSAEEDFYSFKLEDSEAAEFLSEEVQQAVLQEVGDVEEGTLDISLESVVIVKHGLGQEDR